MSGFKESRVHAVVTWKRCSSEPRHCGESKSTFFRSFISSLSPSSSFSRASTLSLASSDAAHLQWQLISHQMHAPVTRASSSDFQGSKMYNCNDHACPLMPGCCMCRSLAEAGATTFMYCASLEWQRLCTFQQLFLCFLR